MMRTGKAVGIVSIPLSQVPSGQTPFDVLMAGTGYNTGNLVFSTAVQHQISGPQERLSYRFDPEAANSRLRCVVIPAANWLHAGADLSDLADRVERLDIPAVIIGLGAQSTDYSSDPEVPEGTLRLLKAVSERSASISVRGHYTAGVLQRLGFNRLTVTGCPSLFWKVHPDLSASILSLARKSEDGPLLLHSTRYSAGHAPFLTEPSLHRSIFRLAFAQRSDLLFQSEPEEISMLVSASGKPTFDQRLIRMMIKLYGARDWYEVRSFVREHGRVFFDTRTWIESLNTYRRVFGTRLHASIIALNCGLPAIIAPHDSRTAEVAEFAHLPSIGLKSGRLTLSGIKRAFQSRSFDVYLSHRIEQAEAYSTFLRDCGIEPNRDNIG